METNYTFRNLESNESLKERTDKKLTKLKKYLIKPGNAHVIFSMDGSNCVVEITLNSDGKQYVGSEVTNDVYTSLNRAFSKVENQVRRHKEQVKSHRLG